MFIFGYVLNYSFLYLFFFFWGLFAQVLVYQNKNVLSPKTESAEPNSSAEKDCVLQFRNVPTYSKKIATKNIKALASCSTELLQALTNLFVDSLPEKRSYLKVLHLSLTELIFRNLIYLLLLSIPVITG